ncbi:mucin-2-like [Scylla paramamosain]|uniref:mucin-2-like n=1 Tax=Scylla paramamosain TaxID=85552 RepID=UPI0030832C96
MIIIPHKEEGIELGEEIPTEGWEGWEDIEVGGGGEEEEEEEDGEEAEYLVIIPRVNQTDFVGDLLPSLRPSPRFPRQDDHNHHHHHDYDDPNHHPLASPDPHDHPLASPDLHDLSPDSHDPNDLSPDSPDPNDPSPDPHDPSLDSHDPHDLSPDSPDPNDLSPNFPDPHDPSLDSPDPNDLSPDSPDPNDLSPNFPDPHDPHDPSPDSYDRLDDYDTVKAFEAESFEGPLKDSHDPLNDPYDYTPKDSTDDLLDDLYDPLKDFDYPVKDILRIVSPTAATPPGTRALPVPVFRGTGEQGFFYRGQYSPEPQSPTGEATDIGAQVLQALQAITQVSTGAIHDPTTSAHAPTTLDDPSVRPRPPAGADFLIPDDSLQDGGENDPLNDPLIGPGGETYVLDLHDPQENNPSKNDSLLRPSGEIGILTPNDPKNNDPLGRPTPETDVHDSQNDFSTRPNPAADTLSHHDPQNDPPKRPQAEVHLLNPKDSTEHGILQPHAPGDILKEEVKEEELEGVSLFFSKSAVPSGALGISSPPAAPPSGLVAPSGGFPQDQYILQFFIPEYDEENGEDKDEDSGEDREDENAVDVLTSFERGQENEAFLNEDEEEEEEEESKLVEENDSVRNEESPLEEKSSVQEERSPSRENGNAEEEDYYFEEDNYSLEKEKSPSEEAKNPLEEENSPLNKIQPLEQENNSPGEQNQGNQTPGETSPYFDPRVTVSPVPYQPRPLENTTLTPQELLRYQAFLFTLPPPPSASGGGGQGSGVHGGAGRVVSVDIGAVPARNTGAFEDTVIKGLGTPLGTSRDRPATSPIPSTSATPTTEVPTSAKAFSSFPTAPQSLSSFPTTPKASISFPTTPQSLSSFPITPQSFSSLPTTPKTSPSFPTTPPTSSRPPFSSLIPTTRLPTTAVPSTLQSPLPSPITTTASPTSTPAGSAFTSSFPTTISPVTPLQDLSISFPPPVLHLIPKEKVKEEEAVRIKLQRPPLASHLPFLELDEGVFAFKDTPDELLRILQGSTGHRDTQGHEDILNPNPIIFPRPQTEKDASLQTQAHIHTPTHAPRTSTAASFPPVDISFQGVPAVKIHEVYLTEGEKEVLLTDTDREEVLLTQDKEDILLTHDEGDAEGGTGEFPDILTKNSPRVPLTIPGRVEPTQEPLQNPPEEGAEVNTKLKDEGTPCPHPDGPTEAPRTPTTTQGPPPLLGRLQERDQNTQGLIAALGDLTHTPDVPESLIYLIDSSEDPGDALTFTPDIPGAVDTLTPPRAPQITPTRTQDTTTTTTTTTIYISFTPNIPYTPIPIIKLSPIVTPSPTPSPPRLTATPQLPRQQVQSQGQEWVWTGTGGVREAPISGGVGGGVGGERWVWATSHRFSPPRSPPVSPSLSPSPSSPTRPLHQWFPSLPLPPTLAPRGVRKQPTPTPSSMYARTKDSYYRRMYWNSAGRSLG